MRLATKISAFYLTATVALVVVLTAIALIAFRAFSLTAATAHAQSAAEIVRVHLTEAMLLGTIGERQRFLERLRDVNNLKKAVVIRSPLVDEQFGKHRLGEAEPDPIERRVLTTGKPYFETVESITETYFRATIPYIATSHGTPNCLQCHMVPEGAVLGAITVAIDLGVLRQHAILTVTGIVLAVALFAASLLWLLHRLLRPVTITAQEIADVVHEGVEGRFERRIHHQSADETGLIAHEVNRLLDAIERAFTQISEQIALVTGWRQRQRNQLQAGVEAVTTMAQIAHFKQAIEEDAHTSHIYRRLIHVSRTTFSIPEIHLLEVRGGEITAIAPDGYSHLSCCPACDPLIASQPDQCRAVRTGDPIDGLTDPTLCVAERVTATHPNHGYLCFPILFSGQVGAVVQWVVPLEEASRYLEAANRFQLFLKEAAPVLESKRLMEQLRENALRDALTGLRNRRFLEESIEMLVAQILRRHSHLAVLMIDIDWFKMVNDTYGHDVGDRLIVHVSKLLTQSVRASDWIIRYGGEEFMIILVDATGEDALPVAEKIRTALESSPIQLNDGTALHKTISIGIADFPGDAAGFWQVVKFADIALYHAKETGRNRVVRFTADLWTSTANGKY
ncbi:MAG: GGDEF domain-containing protein [Hydrogenophilus sp.]|nr:GGDEF domain-containing protein [Hydrogenophilus sp.]